MLNRILGLCALLALTACGGGSGPAATTQPQSSQPKLGDAIDAIVQPYMAGAGVSAAVISIQKDGAPLYEHAYGYQDAAHTQPLAMTALFRVASVVKPVTAATIQILAAQGKLALSDHVICSGNNLPCWLPATLLPASADARVRDITLGQLIAHQGGWDRTLSGDPDIMEPAIRDALGKITPPTREELIRYVLARPLDFTPGSRSAYSNFGYLLLGQVIEQASSTDYVSFVQRTLLAPLGIAAADFQQARTLPADRNPREPAYLSTLMSPSVYTPGKLALAMDEGAETLNWTAAAGIITTAPAMARFAATYSLPDGAALAGGHHDGVKNGDVPGATSVVRQLPSGVSYALYMNATAGFNDEQGPFLKQIDAAIAASVK